MGGFLTILRPIGRLRALSRPPPWLSLITDHKQKICLFPLATAFHGICIDDDTHSYHLRPLCDKISTALLFGYHFLPDATRWFQACSLQQSKGARHPRTKYVTSCFSSSHFRSRSAPAILANWKEHIRARLTICQTFICGFLDEALHIIGESASSYKKVIYWKAW
jgi:hypothetical protein